MLRIQRLLIIVGTIIALALLAGCKPNSTNGSPPPSEPTPTATTNPSPTATTKSSPTPSNGLVTLHVAATAYQTSDTISVTLSNQSTQTIYFPDHLTNCTVILLQHQQVDGNWQAVNPCRLATPTRLHTLDAGKSLEVTLLSKQWLSGLYHATLGYRAPVSSTVHAIYSVEFHVA